MDYIVKYTAISFNEEKKKKITRVTIEIENQESFHNKGKEYMKKYLLHIFKTTFKYNELNFDNIIEYELSVKIDNLYHPIIWKNIFDTIDYSKIKNEIYDYNHLIKISKQEILIN